MPIDGDLTGVWQFHPDGRGQTIDVAGVPTAITVAIDDEYGLPPYLFRSVRQNGSRLHLRLLAAEGVDARYPVDHEFLAGKFVERSAYTSDVRRGRYWTRP